MKKWNAPSVEELNINETAHNLFGNSWDGGYIGDGVLSGHLGWKEPGKQPEGKPKDPKDPVEQLS
mgnify:FL=1